MIICSSRNCVEIYKYIYTYFTKGLINFFFFAVLKLLVVLLQM